jgi:hypothetical protein
MEPESCLQARLVLYETTVAVRLKKVYSSELAPAAYVSPLGITLSALEALRMDVVGRKQTCHADPPLEAC